MKKNNEMIKKQIKVIKIKYQREKDLLEVKGY